MSLPPEKRIKLFLERSIERLPFDITDKAEEIYLPEGNPEEKLKRKIKALADAAGESYDEFTENLPTTQEHNDTTVASEMSLPQDSSTEQITLNQRANTPHGVYAKLWHAQGEIGIALDVLNIIISSYHSQGITATAMPVLPPGTLKCEYVSKVTPSTSTLIANEKVALGGKRNQLRKATSILFEGAQKLRKVMENEDQFWEGALRLRKNNWCIVSAKPSGGQYAHRLGSGSHLFVHYGFRDVGSLHGERAYAELIRNQTAVPGHAANPKSIELHIPSRTNKRVMLSLVQQGCDHAKGSGKVSLRNRTLHTQLLEAQETLFDNELFQELVNEARTMTNSVSIVDNEIFLTINDELELKIAHTGDLPSSQVPPSTPEPMKGIDGSTGDWAGALEVTAAVLRCAMQLIQHRRHRQNIKERSDSFFKSSRPGAGRTPGSFGQIQQSLAARPTTMLTMAIQSLQYYSFSKKIRDVLARVTRNLRLSWWEPISVHSVDVKSPSRPSSTAATPASSHKAPNYGMGSAVSICMGSKTPSLRLVIRSHPAPCVVLQLSDRPSSPIMHVAEFEKVLEQELAMRAIRRICEVANSVDWWSELQPMAVPMPKARFVIDIEKRCVGVLQIPTKNGSSKVHSKNGTGILPANSATLILQLDMKSKAGICLLLTTTREGASRTKRLPLENVTGNVRAAEDTVHPYDTPSSSLSLQTQTKVRSLESFRTWLKERILMEIDFE